jgi:putative methionine-R-sulfoxide reductase with GAF domain
LDADSSLLSDFDQTDSIWLEKFVQLITVEEA